MSPFHTVILSAKLPIHEDRHCKLVGGWGEEHRTHVLTVKKLEKISIILLYT